MLDQHSFPGKDPSPAPNSLADRMDFHVRCDCGEYLRVAEGAAGSRADCRCGRTVAIPTLAVLRQQAGLPPHELSPVAAIENMLSRGELPIARACAFCNQDTAETVHVTAECEKSRTIGPSGMPEFLAVLLLGWWAIFYRANEPPDQEIGRNLILHLPVRSCRRCAHHWLPVGVPLIWGILAMVLAAAGLVLMIAGWPWGGLLLASLVLAGWAEWRIQRRRRRELRKLLACEPTYRQLLDIYPNMQLSCENTP